MLWDEKTRAKCPAKLTAGHFVKYITHYSVSVSVQQIVASISFVLFFFRSLSIFSLASFIDLFGFDQVYI